MFSEDKITKIFCMADVFCKFFDAKMQKYTLPKTTKRAYHREGTLSKAEVMVIKKILLGKCTGISSVDSTPLRVCKN